MAVSTDHARARSWASRSASPLKRVCRGVVSTLTAFGLLVGTAAAASAYDTGVDVSRWQHPNGASIDWSSVKAGGVTFAFIKATESTTYTNPYFAGDWAATRAVGLYHGAYHYARPSVGSAAAQARYFVSKAGLADQPGDLPPVLDLEANGGLSVSQLRTWTTNWLDTVEDLTGRKPIIYTGPYFWETSMGNSTAYHAYPLWIAHYTTGQPRVPGGWPTWTFWQSTSSGRVNGISGNVDMDSFNGTPTQLAALAQAPAPAQPPPSEEQPPTSPAPATAVTLQLSRTSVYAGESVTFSGALTTDTGAPLAGGTVVLRSRPTGDTTWSTVAALPTDAAGHFATTSKVVAAADYKVTVAATDTYARAASAVRSVAITPKAATALTLTAGRTKVRKGTRVKLFGHLVGSTGAGVAGKRVRYLVRPAGSTRWSLLGSSTSGAPTGWHQLYVRPRRTSTYKAVFAGDLRHAAARSGLVKVSVRR